MARAANVTMVAMAAIGDVWADAGSPAWEAGAVYTGTAWGVLTGDHDGDSAWHGNVDLTLTLDTGRLIGLDDSTLFIYVLNDHGGKFNKNLATGQGIDNMEVETNATRLFEAWVEKRFLDGRMSVRAGLYAVDGEFYVTDSSGLFIHPAQGIGTDLGQTGLNGPSIFPVTSMGIRVLAEPVPELYLMGAVVDAVPGDPDDPRGTHVILDEGDGALGIVEAGWRFPDTLEQSLPGKIAVGGYAYSEEFDDLLDVDVNGDPITRDARGFYVMAERAILRDPANPARGPSVFVRYGHADPDIHQFGHAVTAGVTWQGPFAARADDIVGFGIAAATTGDKFRQAAATAGEPAATAEIAYEWSYLAPVNEWLVVQPDVQYIQYTGDGDIDDALVAGLRIEISY